VSSRVVSEPRVRTRTPASLSSTARMPFAGLAGLLRRVPTAAWVCAVVALLNAACWSLVTPPLEGIDEPDHVAYVQELAQTGRLPTAGTGDELSQEETVLAEDLHQGLMRFSPQFPAISSDAEQRELQRDLAASFPPVGPVNAGTAESEPPLYYALETIPYALGSWGDLLDRLQLMRVFSGLIAAVAVLLCFLFVRETLPSVPWAWTVGALAVAVMPLLGFVSGAVNPEVLLVAVSAALFYLLARAFRRGLTRPLALAIGAATAIGFLTKLNFLGLAPGVLVGLSILALRAPRASRAAALRSAAAAALIACAPVALYVLIDALAGRPLLGAAAAVLQLVRGSVAHEISYVWQFYLPKLPGMEGYFPGVDTTRALWFDGVIGRFGWDDVFFPAWVYDLALIPAAALAALGLRELVLGRRALGHRVAEVLTYSVMAVGLLALVGADSYMSQHSGAGGPYWQPRYLLPLVPLLAAALALAARGAGARWGRVAGVWIVVLFFANDLFGQLQTVARYYG
jgi:4-amino-4-deoxy-L-arabinose transferase-like glycosyltransferase